ncbi:MULTISPECIES: hypothetical protein [unclassified Neptuniibacter]|uniref:hypothetical protein n=1 Tax=unclassified Neptuniibacter TaxID=2630693 RepID=UPI000C51C7FF|nr:MULTISPECIES: hypothetical protein [unclassified Neptuniibacter]MAY42607.1 hypothetical protein [Oceanospirillaceae bacterium]
MARTNWKRKRARSLRHGMELCISHAKEVHHRSVETVAEMMGEATHWNLYKWMESGRMPAIKIRAFETACGADFVTQYLAYSANKLIVDMPTGRKAQHKELSDLGSYANKVMSMLIDFNEGRSEQKETSEALATLIEDLAHQRGNVEKFQQPELL